MLDDPVVQNMIRNWSQVPAAALRIALILVLAWILHLLVQRVLRGLRSYLVSRAATSEEGKRIETLGGVAKRVSSMVIVALTSMLVLSVVGISIAPILGAAGVVGIAVGFAAQSLIKDYFHGFFLLVENQLRIGDIVELGGKSGVVEEITLRFVRLRSEEGTIHFVPNSLVTTLSNRSLRPATVFIDVGLKPDTDPLLAQAALEHAVAECAGHAELKDRLVEAPRVLGIHSIGEHVTHWRVQFRLPVAHVALARREFFALLSRILADKGVSLADPLRAVLAS